MYPYSNATHDEKRRILRTVFGFEAFRPGQERVIDALLAGRSVLTVMPTGSGKSLCFQIPALVSGGLTIVVSPLVALMQDQVESLKLAGVVADTINSSQKRTDNLAAWQRVVTGETRLLYLSPERLMSRKMLAALSKLDLRFIVVDEAHCISQWGPAFRPEYQDLTQLKNLFPETPIIALTATADKITREDISTQLFTDEAFIMVLGFDRPNIKMMVDLKRGWKTQLLTFVANHKGESGIVYCLSRKKSEETATLLCENGVRALPYHAGMDKVERENNQNIFMTETGVVIVATIAFGMGIDKADVRYVFHTDLPGSIEAYYQEIGRAGRDDEPAEAYMLYGLSDIRMRRVFIEQEEAGEDRKRREHHKLDGLLSYCESPTCRRRLLLAHFGEHIEPCGNCDICLNPINIVNGTKQGQMVLNTIKQTGQRFGAVHIINVLLGSLTEKVARGGHNNLSTFGAGNTLKKEQWRSLIRQLVASGFLHLDVQGYGGLSITEKGVSLLKGENNFNFRPDTIRAEKPPRAKAKSVTAIDVVSKDQETLFEKLKALRLQLAKAQRVPAYVIFTDRSLIEMVHLKPSNKDEFAVINGVGAAKLKKFAVPFLKVISDSELDN